jgi:hypothetical protein
MDETAIVLPEKLEVCLELLDLTADRSTQWGCNRPGSTTPQSFLQGGIFKACRPYFALNFMTSLDSNKGWALEACFESLPAPKILNVYQKLILACEHG